ncbi:glycine oxidase [Bacillus mesophilus]|uniref:glycine oxidase n=1 Tax=Bacillus mesophilus TaxID=1808955 RepID=A0A6M0Q3U0_9BACI|nr:glycine oxidase [Bacillus mesophilus]NEY70843.1 glycine oxidase ThiO [Bacillus mesophilus]
MKNHYDTIVVGGGIIGHSVAYSLLKRGQSVLVIEKGEINLKASSAAAGMLAAQAEVTEAGPLFDLARKSRNMFPKLSEELMEVAGIDIELIQNGMLTIAYNKEREEQLKQTVRLQKTLGEEARWLAQEEVVRAEQNLSNQVLGAMYAPNDGQVSAYKLATGFAVASGVLGGRVLEFTEVIDFLIQQGKVQGVKTSQGEFYGEHVVVAGGAWSVNFLEQIGIDLGLYPVKGECLSVLTRDDLITSTIFSEDCYIVPKKDGRLYIGATVIPHSFDEKVTVEGVSRLLHAASELLPSLKNEEWERAWTGIRPQTNDGFPYLGEHPEISGLYVATGHYRNGILLSPITGEIIADIIEGNPLSESASAFSLKGSRRGQYEVTYKR